MANEKKILNGYNRYPVIDRIQNAVVKFGIEVTEQDKTMIGEKCIQAFFNSPKHLYLKKETIVEKSGPVEVCVYPSHFVPVIDKIIIDHFQINTKTIEKQ